MNPNFRDILFALADEGADFLIVGAFAVAHYGIARSTGDIDILVRPNLENAKKVWRALLRFGAPLGDLTVEELSQPNLIFTMGREPQRIDIITDIDGVDFDAAASEPSAMMVDERSFPVIGIKQLLINKKAAGRLKDVVDAKWLEKKIRDAES